MKWRVSIRVGNGHVGAGTDHHPYNVRGNAGILKVFQTRRTRRMDGAVSFTVGSLEEFARPRRKLILDQRQIHLAYRFV